MSFSFSSVFSTSIQSVSVLSVLRYRTFTCKKKSHYESMPMQNTEIFSRGGSNEYLQCMFWTKNKKIRYTPANPIFFYINVGFKGVYISRTYFPDACQCIVYPLKIHFYIVKLCVQGYTTFSYF